MITGQDWGFRLKSTAKLFCHLACVPSVIPFLHESPWLQILSDSEYFRELAYWYQK